VGSFAGSNQYKRAEAVRLRLTSINLAFNAAFDITAPEFVLGKKAGDVDGQIRGNNAISRRHCVIEREGENYFARDLGSSNGTFVNAERLRKDEKVLLKDGDILRLADTEFAVAISNDTLLQQLQQESIQAAAEGDAEADAPTTGNPKPQVLSNRRELVDERAVIVLRVHSRQMEVDLDVPLNITATELLVGVNEAYQLGIDTNNSANCFLRTENPIALLRGSKELYEYGVHNGTIINI
jgi:uncharacterized ubiquitin-like protein YukD